MRGMPVAAVTITSLVLALACGGEGGETTLSGPVAEVGNGPDPSITNPAKAAPTGDGPLCCRARGKNGEPDQFSNHSPSCSGAYATFGSGVVGDELDKMVAEKLHPFEEYRGPECEVVCCDMSSNPMSQTFGQMTRGECTKYRGEAPGRCLGVPDAKACNVGAVVADPDPAGLNVRDAPKGKTVKGQIFQGAQVSLTGSKDGWVHVSEVWDPERDMETWPTGWVAAKLLETYPKTDSDYGPGNGVTAYYDSAYGNEVRFSGKAPTKATVRGCEGDFIQLEFSDGGSTKRGWLPGNAHCPSSVTTCP